VFSTASPYTTLPPFDDSSDDINVIVETPQGSQNKYKFDAKLGLF
jgi:inorganic pyrophosphatase